MEKEDKTQVVTQTEELRKAVSKIEKEVSSLRDKLKSVLRNDTLEHNEKSEEKIVALVPLANDLRAIVSRIDNLNNSVTTILRELEL